MNMNRLQQTLNAIDDYNRQDPNSESWEGKTLPKEWLYGQRMTDWLLRLEPQASEALQLAARAQHIGRWTIARDEYPRDRKGYLKWRTMLKLFHAKTVAEIMEAQGYDEHLISQVQTLVKKDKLKTDPDTQLLEDVICMVFLQYYFEDFARQHPEEKIVDIVQKTWAKMSPRGHEQALRLDFSPAAKKLISQALNPSA